MCAGSALLKNQSEALNGEDFKRGLLGSNRMDKVQVDRPLSSPCGESARAEKNPTLISQVTVQWLLKASGFAHFVNRSVVWIRSMPKLSICTHISSLCSSL